MFDPYFFELMMERQRELQSEATRTRLVRAAQRRAGRPMKTPTWIPVWLQRGFDADPQEQLLETAYAGGE